MTRLVRPRRGRRLGGVCAALAERFDVRVSRVRLLFALLVVLPGPALVLYAALWLVLPSEDSATRHAW